MNEIVIRSYSQPVETLIVSRADGTSRKIRGIAAVYYNGQPGSEFRLGQNIMERIAPGAFDHLLEDDVMARVDHDGKLIVGRNKQNMRLWSTSRGMEYEIDLKPTTAGNDLWENAQSGIIKGSSFQAVVNFGDKKSVTWSRDGKQDILTVKRYEQLIDVAPVSNPAYKASTCEAVMRSLDEHNLMNETIKRIARANFLLGK